MKEEYNARYEFVWCSNSVLKLFGFGCKKQE